MRLARIATPFVALGLVLGACSSDDSSSNDPDTTTDEAVDFDLIADGKLTVCTDAPYEPFEFQDEAGEWTGFDMDLMREIAALIGDLELEVTVQPFDGIWLAPQAGTCDIVASAMTITEERAANTLFTDGYFDADQSLLVRAADADTYDSLESLAGKSIGVQTGTTGADYANENKPEGATIIEYEDAAAMFLALESGEVDALLQDLPVNAERALKNPDNVLSATFSTGEQYGFAVSPSNAGLAEAVNEALATLRDNGGYDEIYGTYFAS
jgi:polar amino acid transport system substrate-binding protein